MTTGRSVLIVTMGNLSSPIVALVTAPILARTLGPAGRGEVAAATAPLLLLVAALTLGLPDAISYFTAKYGGVQKKTFAASALVAAMVGFLGFCGIWIAAPWLSGGDDALRDLIRWCSLALPLALVAGCVRGVARGHQRWKLVAADQLVASLVKLVGIVALLATGTLTPESAAIVLSAAVVAGVLAYTPLVSSQPGKGQHPKHVTLPAMLRFGMATWVSAIVGVALSRLDQILILPLSSAAALGIYALSTTISDMTRVFNSAVRDIIFVEQSAKVDDLRLAKATRISSILTLFIGACLALAAWLFVVPVFGEDFSQARAVILILLVGVVLGNPGSVVGAGLSARGRPILRSIAMSIGLVLNILLLFALAPSGGAIGAAIASAIATAATGLSIFFLAYFAFGMKPWFFLRFERSDISEIVIGVRRIVRRSRGTA